MTLYLTQLDSQDLTYFPSVDSALQHPDGLLAIGGDLSSARLMAAYQQGIFPWFSENEPYLWWSPSKRAIFIPSEFHASRSLQKYVKKHAFKLSLNTDFESVITHCALNRGQDKVWITKEMRQAYRRLYQLGFAHSVELWLDDTLVGGMYGVLVGNIFCAESMFSLMDNASKIVLWKFSDYFALQGGKLIECQMLSPHLASLGAKEIPRKDYIELLKQNAKSTMLPTCFTPQFFL